MLFKNTATQFAHNRHRAFTAPHNGIRARLARIHYVLLIFSQQNPSSSGMRFIPALKSTASIYLLQLVDSDFPVTVQV